MIVGTLVVSMNPDLLPLPAKRSVPVVHPFCRVPALRFQGSSRMQGFGLWLTGGVGLWVGLRSEVVLGSDFHCGSNQLRDRSFRGPDIEPSE